MSEKTASCFKATLKRAAFCVGAICYLELYLHFIIYAKAVPYVNLVYLLAFSVAYGLVGAALSSIGSPKLNRILTYIWLVFMSLLYMTQYVYHLFFRTPLLVFSLFHGGQVAEFAGEAIRMIFRHLPQLLGFLLPVLVLILWGKKLFSAKAGRSGLVLLACAVLCYGGALALLPTSGSAAPNSAYNCFYNENNPLPTQEKLGMITFFQLDARRLLFGFTPKDLPETRDLPGQPAAAQKATPSTHNMLDLDLSRKIMAEQDPARLQLHQYINGLTPSRKNEYTGRFAGKNLIVITAESFYYPLLKTGLFPAVERLANEGFTFTNAYTPLWNVSTSDGEFAVMSSLVPASGTWSFARSAENAMPFSLAHLLRGEGYESVYAFHNHTYNYYQRQLSHPNLGYTYLAKGNGLEISDDWPESDVELMEASLPYFIHNAPFHVYDLSVSGHLEYDFDKNAMAARHREDVADLAYSEEVKAYIACNLELEAAVEYLLKELEANGELENTVIVLSADHYPYALSDAALNELVGHEVDPVFERYRNTIAIWSADQEHLELDAPVCSLDILPTLLNLFGLDYDSRLLMGRDVFSDTPALVLFNDRSWITDEGRYDATNDILYGDLEPEYVDAVNQVVNAKFYYSAQILFHDYYRSLFPE